MWRRPGQWWRAGMAGALLAAGTPRAAELALWNYDVIDHGTGARDQDDLKPMVLVGARGGRFSGAVGVSSSAVLRGLRATVVPVQRPGAAGRLPPSSSDHVHVRYAERWQDVSRWQPPGRDILLEAAPAELALRGDRASIGIWVTIAVPPETPAGMFHGELRIEAENHAPQSVPIELRVADWTLPNSQDWRTWMELIQSPDTLALEYKEPLWTERHWAMIARSFQLMRPTGSRVVYIPLLSRTNQGNEESMVRWIRGRDGSLRPDFRIVDRYLDVAEKNLGRPKMIVLYAWDTALLGGENRPQVNSSDPSYSQAQQRLAQRRWDEKQKGLSVTVVDEVTGAVERGFLPLYSDPRSRERWQPVYDGLRERLRRRGLEDTLMLGMVTDSVPSQPDVEFLHKVSGGLAWVAHRHPGGLRNRPAPNKLLRGVADIGYEAHVYNIVYQVNPERGRMYGWKIPEHRVFFGRHGIPNGPPLRVRLLPELNITGRQRGVGRVGADFWFVLRDNRGRRSSAVYGRYPENNWRNLDIDSWVLAPGPEGPVSTARLENLIEGLQECEARIFLEDALLDAAKRARLGDDLAARAQALLDERQIAMWRTVWSNEEHLAKLGTLGDVGNARNAPEAVWQGLGRAGVKLPGFWDQAARDMRGREERQGIAWFVESGWQERNARLFALAGEAAGRLQR